MYHRICKPLLSNSLFLFGPRGTGKTTLLRELFADHNTLWIDLLKHDQLLDFVRDPQALRRRIRGLKSPPRWVIIDEIQKVPRLLDEVHSLIEDHSFSPRLKFALTGSSARKLKRGAANLLAGRALVNKLHPLTSVELGADLDVDSTLHWGALPNVVTASSDIERQEILRAYALVYLKEEIREEQLIRKLDPFLRFLEIAAQSNGNVINYSKIARDIESNSKTVERYFQILEDTLIGFFLDPFHKSVRKRQSKRSKFYLFDTGVKRALDGTLVVPILPRTYEYGNAFEHFVILELIRLNDYYRADYRFFYLMTKDIEVDVIVERPGKKTALVEIKSGRIVDEVEVRKLATIANSFPNSECFMFSQVSAPVQIGTVAVLPWKEGLSRLF